MSDIVNAAVAALNEKLGGADFDSGTDGPTVLFRAELDALPIEERTTSRGRPCRPARAMFAVMTGI